MAAANVERIEGNELSAKEEERNARFKRIMNWREKHQSCYYCGETRSVKYEVYEDDVEKVVPCCNLCAWYYIGAD